MRISKRLKQKKYQQYQQKKKKSSLLPAPELPAAPAEIQYTPCLPPEQITSEPLLNKPAIEQNKLVPQIIAPPIPIIIRNQQNMRFILISLLLAVISSFWLMQKSINAYYQQTYHKDSPLVYMEKNQVWFSGAQVADQLNQWLSQAQQYIAEQNSLVTQQYNQQYAYTPEYRAYLQQEMKKRQAIAAKQATAAHQQAVQDRKKTDFTLNHTDEVFFAGDSLMQGVAPHVQKWLSEQYGIKSVNLSKQSTGLAYPRFFDWPKTISDTLATNKNIKILVVYLGPNDPWNMPDPKGGNVYLKFQTPQWADVYRQRISTIIQTAKKHHVTVLWLMPPNVRRNKLNQQLIYLRQLMADEVAKNQAYIMNTSHMLGSDGTKYSDTLLDSNGQRIKTRSADGIHFSFEGQKIIARNVLNYFYVQP